MNSETFLEEPQLAESEIPTRPVKEKRNWGRLFLGIFLEIIETIILAGVLFLGINAVTARVLVDGHSMHPTLENNEYILVNKISFRSKLPEQGDIIVFHFPINPEQDFIKRVIGLPGDEISIESGEVRVNGQVLAEPYIASAPTYVGTWHVSDDQIFVLGDNRNNSSDSHSWGVVPMDEIIGKAVFVYWPPTEWKVLKHD